MTNSFDDRSVKRIARTVRVVEKSPVLSPTYRRRGRGISPSNKSSLPFTISLSKDAEENQLVTISQGAIIVQDVGGGTIKYSVQSNSVDINSFAAGKTIYVYAKIEVDWEDATGFKGFGTLIVKVDDDDNDDVDIEKTNFAVNSVKQPSTDSNNYFYEIGNIVITDKDGAKVYKINQIAIENGELSAFRSNSFTVVQLPQGKNNDSDDDTTYDVYTNNAFAFLPDNTVTLSKSVDSVPIDGAKVVVLKVSATQNAQGFFTNFTAVIEYSISIPSNTLTDSYYAIATIGASFTQHQEIDFLSDGRIW